MPADSPVSVTEWPVTKAASLAVSVSEPGSVPRSTRESATSWVVQVTVAVPSACGIAATAVISGGVMSEYSVVYAPAVAAKNAYGMPLMICVVYTTGTALRLISDSGPIAEFSGTIACILRDPAAAVIMKLSLFPLHASPPNEEPLRPSSHVSICCADTTGTPCAWADATMASEPGCGDDSRCMFVVKTP